MRPAFALLGVAAVAGLLGASRPGLPGGVTDVRHWSYATYTRVVVELTRPVETEVHRLPANTSAGRSERLYLDLEGVWVGRRFEDPIPVADGLLRAVRLGQNTRSKTRLVIDLERYERHRLLVLRSPDRVVVDVFGDDSAHEPEARRGSPRLAASLRPIRTVVVDPGHGGRDPGAVGVAGLREKDVTLRLARALRSRLEERGFDVVLTRHGDEEVSLEERTAIAEGEGGDLFISLHANAAGSRSARGVETYYLDESHERHTLRVASHENQVAPAQLDALQRTVASLRVSEVSRQSGRLAAEVHREMIRGLRRRYRPIEDLGVKTGPFYVLFLSDMPAVLVEAGFLTHREDSRRLRDSGYLDAMAQSIARAVASYREHRALVVARGGG